MENFEMSIESIQEGEEWISRLEQEADRIRLDIVVGESVISPVGIGILRYNLQKTEGYIESIRFEMIAIGMELDNE